MSRRAITRLCIAAQCAALIIGVGCSDTASPGPSTVERQNQLALGLGKAMGRAEVRLAVRDAMRASRVTEHKLIFQDFITTEAGKLVIAEMARQLGSSERAVRGLIDGLPRMQFYAPIRAHRRTWTGGDNVAVAVNLTQNRGQLSAVDPFGTAVSYDMTGKPQEVDNRPALFVIDAAESMNLRVNAQPATAGDVIQDAADGELSGEIHYTDALGLLRKVQLADVVMKRSNVAFDCEVTDIICEGGGDEGGGGGYPSPTWIRPLVVLGVCDHTNCFEGNEFEFFVDIVNVNGVVRTSNFIRLEGVGSTVQYDSVFLIQNHVNPGEWMNVDIWERDDWLDTDDSFDPNPNVYSHHNARFNSEATFLAGDIRPLHCYPLGTNQNCMAVTRELGMRFFW